jgi:hypothetical protein
MGFVFQFTPTPMALFTPLKLKLDKRFLSMPVWSHTLLTHNNWYLSNGSRINWKVPNHQAPCEQNVKCWSQNHVHKTTAFCIGISCTLREFEWMESSLNQSSKIECVLKCISKSLYQPLRQNLLTEKITHVNEILFELSEKNIMMKGRHCKFLNIS